MKMHGETIKTNNNNIWKWSDWWTATRNRCARRTS